MGQAPEKVFDSWCHVLFLDIETVPIVPSFALLPADMQQLWTKKHSWLAEDHPEWGPDDSFKDKAALYAEFAKTVCAGVGWLQFYNGKLGLKAGVVKHTREAELLTNLSRLIQKRRVQANRPVYLCSHNGREFDFPFLGKRLVINRLQIPSVLQIAGKRPWETQLYDTLELWKFGSRRGTASLQAIASVLGVHHFGLEERSYQAMADVFHQEKELLPLAQSALTDVVLTAQIFLRMMAQTEIDPAELDLENLFEEPNSIQ